MEPYRLTAGSPRADPRKTTGNVLDAGAGMMHDTDEDKVTTDINSCQKRPHRFTHTNAASERFCSAVPLLVLRVHGPEHCEFQPSTTNCLFSINFLPFFWP